MSNELSALIQPNRDTQTCCQEAVGVDSGPALTVRRGQLATTMVQKVRVGSYQREAIVIICAGSVNLPSSLGSVSEETPGNA